ncbi:uncharacterized protein LOC111063318 [Nilaparvata lugens]|uniref:uncharacterized protein LOC111063318 n=1 Tax=Nilaparvata lugens TaxID=108931 RepID=UPI00193D08FC|nr:uncharacterized protein LOC111063318 [Nilaparvata lugens]
MEKFLKEIIEVGDLLSADIKCEIPMEHLSDRQQREFQNADKCGLCDEVFTETDTKVNGKDIELTEVGPRFMLRLYEIKLGMIDTAAASDTEWALLPYMNTAIKRRFLSFDDGWIQDDDFEEEEAQIELEVTGISRSGRVRKKSSKLTDFESPDEIDKYRRKSDKFDPPPSYPVGRPAAHAVKIEQFHHSEEEDEAPNFKEEMLSDSDPEMDNFPHDEDDLSSMDSMGSPGDEEDLDESIGLDQGGEGFQRIAPDSVDTGSPVHGSAQSLYMSEKSTKKKLVIRDGKIVDRMKAQRKDKGL